MAQKRRAFAHHDPRQARAWLALGFAAGVVTALAIPARFGTALRAVAGWDTASVVMNALAWWIIARFSPAETRQRAADDDPGRTLVWALVLIASAASFFT